MTLNERLYAAGLLDVFDEAVRSGDRSKIVDYLQRVDIGPAEAESTADQILSDPTRYGRI